MVIDGDDISPAFTSEVGEAKADEPAIAVGYMVDPMDAGDELEESFGSLESHLANLSRTIWVTADVITMPIQVNAKAPMAALTSLPLI